MYPNKEHFSTTDINEKVPMKSTKDICHYSCSKLKLTNILMVLIILILLYMIFRKKKDLS
jgi:hypothetical protein